MPFNPEEVLGEVLGQRAKKGANPGASDFRCPYIKARCTKRSTSLPGEAYPVCSIRLNKPHQDSDLICVCPKRFFAVDFLKDVIEHCWSGMPPANPTIAREVQMKGFGNVDFVIAEADPKTAEIGRFLSVELQAIDITGSVMPAYLALKNQNDLPKKPTYGLNWDNVYKRYVTQLVRKDYFHHHWGSKIVAVIQDRVYENICSRAEFMRTSDVKDNQNVNIIFMAYRFESHPQRPGEYRLSLTKVEGTAHSSLQNAIMYKEAPSREAFCQRIKKSIER